MLLVDVGEETRELTHKRVEHWAEIRRRGVEGHEITSECANLGVERIVSVRGCALPQLARKFGEFFPWSSKATRDPTENVEKGLEIVHIIMWFTRSGAWSVTLKYVHGLECAYPLERKTTELDRQRICYGRITVPFCNHARRGFRYGR